MAVTFDSSKGGHTSVPGLSTSGSVSVTHVTNTLVSDVVAFGGILFTSDVNLSGNTFSVSWGGTSMTLISAQYWDSNKCTLQLFALEGIDDLSLNGSETVTASVSGLSTELGDRNFMFVTGTWSGVETVGSTTSPSPTSTTSNSVTVASTLPAHKVITLHGTGKSRRFTAFDQRKRAGEKMLFAGEIILGEADGDSSVTSTATINAATDNWGAIGLSLAPSIVDGAASLTVPVARISAAGDIYRTAYPSPDRYYTIPAERGVGRG